MNGQCPSWVDVPGVPQGSILLHLFLIYINDLTDNLTSNQKLFADDTSLFSTVTDQNPTANQINNDFHSINTWAYQWKMNFNPDTSRQGEEFIISRKIKLLLILNLISTITQYMKAQLKNILEYFSI